MPPVGGNGHRGAVVVVCGEHLDAADRTACAAQASEEGASERRDVPDLVIVQGLCAHPERVSDFWRKARPEALVAVACTQTGAARAAEQAVADGMDAARVAAISLAPGLALEPPEARVRWVAATCRAGSQRARLLVGQPKAGRIPWRAGQTLSRRTLLGDLRGPPSRSAHIDGARCWGAERCSRCRSDCPTGAIRTGTVPQVDLQACVSCGRCVTTCPTGAISMPGADLTGLAAEVDTFLAAGVSDLAVTCARRSTPDNCTVPPQAGGPQAVVTLPCVAMFGPGARLGVLASGARLRIEPCDSCGCHQTVEADARFVDRLLALTGGVPEHPVAVEADPGGRGIGWCEPEATNAAVAALLGGSNSADPATHGPPTLDPGAPTRVVRIDDTRCTACGSCALACP
ncbi:MAG: 4Fe-4S binding protein, partial [Actinomycetota bacterium]|nr:4Fe-4S binding protein [Actinomycetota bacterium]